MTIARLKRLHYKAANDYTAAIKQQVIKTANPQLTIRNIISGANTLTILAVRDEIR